MAAAARLSLLGPLIMRSLGLLITGIDAESMIVLLFYCMIGAVELS